jgi:hypothetical protein
MAKKPRSQRRKKGSAEVGGAGATVTNDDEVDYLSESHTIATLGSGTTATTHNNNINADDASFDAGWDMQDDDALVEDAHPDDNAVRAAEMRHQKLLDVLSTIPDYQGEKRTAKREGLLRLWFRGLTQYATTAMMMDHPVQDRRDDLIRSCRYGLRNGSPAEQYAACRVLEATAVLIGDDDYYERVYDPLLKLLQSSHRAVPVRVAALRALGMAVLIGIEDDDDKITEHILDLCESLAQPDYRGDPVPSALRATALDVWTVLATTIHVLYVAGKDDVSTGRGLLLLPLLLECLEQEADLGLRAAAGECVAWVHTARVNLGFAMQAAETTGGQPMNATERHYRQGGWEGSEWEDIMAEIQMVMEELSNQSGHYMSKKAKKEQRATFREYLATIQDNEDPEHVVQFRGGSLELHSWKDIIALNFIRRCLQGGFQIQLLTNPTLQAMFGANGQTLNSNEGYSQLQKRLLLSKTSEAAKVKDLDRNKKRRNRNNVKNHFLTADGDDI